MRKSSAIVLSAFILLAVTSCDLQKKRLQKCQKWGVCSQNDSTTTALKDSTSEKDSLIGQDSVVTDLVEFFLKMVFASDSLNNVHVKQIDSINAQGVQANVVMKGDTLIQRIYVPSKTIYVPKYMRVRSRYVDASKESVKTVTVKVNELKWHQSARLWLFNLALIIALLLFGWKMLKLYIYKKLP